MGIRGWAAAAALSVCAWAGQAGATVYNVTVHLPEPVSPVEIPDYSGPTLATLLPGDYVFLIIILSRPYTPPDRREVAFTISSNVPQRSDTLFRNGGADPGVVTRIEAFIAYDKTCYFYCSAPVEFNSFGVVASAVPEPSTWAMMLIGFAGLGFAANRRRAITA